MVEDLGDKSTLSMLKDYVSSTPAPRLPMTELSSNTHRDCGGGEQG